MTITKENVLNIKFTDGSWIEKIGNSFYILYNTEYSEKPEIYDTFNTISKLKKIMHYSGLEIRSNMIKIMNDWTDYAKEIKKNNNDLLKIENCFFDTVCGFDSDDKEIHDINNPFIKDINHVKNVNKIKINKKKLNYNIVGYELKKEYDKKTQKIFCKKYDVRKNTLDSFQHFVVCDGESFPILNKTQKLLKLYNFCDSAKKDGWKVKFLYK